MGPSNTQPSPPCASLISSCSCATCAKSELCVLAIVRMPHDEHRCGRSILGWKKERVSLGLHLVGREIESREGLF